MHVTLDLAGWHLALVKAPEPGAGFEAYDPFKGSEWLFIDPHRPLRQRGRHALGPPAPHEPPTPAPAVRPWPRAARRKAWTSCRGPWQAIYIGGPSMVSDIRRREHGYEHHRNIDGSVVSFPFPFSLT